MGFDFVVLGATGMQGKIVSKDLLEKGYSVLLCGRDKSRILHFLEKYKKSHFQYIDVRDSDKLVKILSDSGAKVVINCVEGNWNLSILGACIRNDMHSIDLGSEIEMTKQQLALDPKLKKKGLIHITGMGSIPGVCNVMLSYAADKLDKIETVDTGFAWDSNIKKFVVPFSMESILKEFSDYAVIVNNGRFAKKKPMDSIIDSYHKEIGKQKEFLIIHPEVYTFYLYYKNKGLKNVKAWGGFPQHSFEKIMAILELGFSSEKEIEVESIKVKPINVLTQILKGLKMPKGYTETENLWVRINGKKDGKKKQIIMECIVPTLKGWEDAGCNIDTGLPASIVAVMIKEGVLNEKGSFAPEGIIPPKLFFKELRKRDMAIFENGKAIN